MSSESGHWYTQSGDPAYTIIGKNGKERNTTVKDAREHNLVPSVTTILNIAAKPGLNNWLQQQVLLAALTLPRMDGEPESDWLDRVMSDSRSTGRQAAERGTAMHGVLEKFYRTKEAKIWPSYVIETDRALTAHFGEQNWTAETSFAHHKGFGGKVDLSAPDIVVDFKTKEGSLDKVTAYHEHVMQLAAYSIGLDMGNARCANVFVNEQGDVKIIEHSQQDLEDAWMCFECLLMFYKIKNNL